MKKRNVTFLYGLVLYIYWTGYAAIGAFAATYLLAKGLSNTQIGAVLAIGGLSAALFQPFVGAGVDHSRKVSNRHVLSVLGLCLALFCGLIHLTGDGPILTVAAVYALTYILMMLAQPFTNALAVEYMNSGHTLLFGISRACGSFGYAVAASVMGTLTAGVGVWTVPIVSTCSFFVMALVTLFMPRIQKEVVETRKKAALSPPAFLRKYKIFACMLLGIICLCFGHTLINTYALQILMDKGGNSKDVGTAATIAAIAEMLPMFTYPFLKKHLRLGTLMRIAAICFTLKVVASLLTPTVLTFFFAQILQAGAWGVFTVTLVYIVNELVAMEDSSQGQAFAGMSITIGNVISSLVCGRLLDAIGVSQTLIVASIVSLLGCLVIFLTTGKKEVSRA